MPDNKLSKPTTVSLTYCGCCSGHVKYGFENSLGVKLRLIETVSSPIQGLKPKIHTNTIAADDVTWAILPYVYEQYGN